ncbi:MAG: S-layer homology domain-containing protein, partial [Sedimentibacter sp.]
AEISKGKLDLSIKTSIGNIEISNKALEKISDQTDGSNVEIIMDKVDKQKLAPKQKSTVGDDVVYDISIMSKEKLISSFGGQEITISLPYTLKEGQIKDKVSTWYLNDNGELEKIQCKYDEATGLATFATNHLSYYIVGYDNSIIFNDVNEDDWFYDSVMYAVQKGLFTGTSDITFSPNSPMTRSMLVTVIHRLGEAPISTAINPFTDVKDSDWYMQAVKWSLENDLVKGVTSTEFKPQNNVTREQLAVMLYRFAKINGLNTEIKGNIETFADKQNVSSWAYESMTWAVDNGLISGKENNVLDPSGNATRAEAATILHRFNEKLKYKAN